MICLRSPIGLAMLMVGFFGTWLVTGSWVPIPAQLKSLTYDTFSNYSLSIVPLFLLMGQFATRGGMSKALFKAAETRSEEHTSELQSLMRISYAVFCLKKKKLTRYNHKYVA